MRVLPVANGNRDPSIGPGRAESGRTTLMSVFGKSNGERLEAAESHAAGIRGSHNKNSSVRPRPVSVEATGNPELTCWQRIPAGADVAAQTRAAGKSGATRSASLRVGIPEPAEGERAIPALRSFYDASL